MGKVELYPSQNSPKHFDEKSQICKLFYKARHGEALAPQHVFHMFCTQCHLFFRFIHTRVKTLMKTHVIKKNLMRCVVSCWGFFRWMWIASGRCWSLAYQMNGHLWLIGVQKKFKQMNESCDKKMVSLFDQNWMANGNLKGGADKIIKINSDVEGSLAVSEGAWGVSLNRGGWWVWLWREAIESVLQQYIVVLQGGPATQHGEENKSCDMCLCFSCQF